MDAHEQIPEIILKPRKALPFFFRHPWVYSTAIKSYTSSPEVGQEVIVRADDGSFIGRGLFNPHSKIRVRLYGWEESTNLDESFWGSKIRSAIALRKKLFGETTTWKACRLIFSEADGLSGVIVDRIDDWLVVQWTSAALAIRQQEFVKILQEELSPRGIWLRTEKGIKELEGLELSDGLVAGETPPRPLFIDENFLRFGVDLVEGQKTGFYFDQRENRNTAAKYAVGADVLDLFCYTGSFALNAAREPSCKSVLAVDSSASSLEIARMNADMNGLSSKVTFQQSDAFDAMQELHAQGRRFDLIILDPPKMARTRSGINRALKAYLRLNQMALGLMDPNGILISCSCSGLVSEAEFEQVLAKASLEANRPLQILEKRGQAPDHPVSTTCFETSYLKAYVCRIVE